MITRRQFVKHAGVSLAFVGTLPWKRGFRFLVGEDGKPLDFGALEPLAALMQDTDADTLLPLVVEKLRGGLPLAEVVAAAALANARTFGGENYNGYHAMMALLPALAMAEWMPGREAALPVLKVVHRNTRFLRESGGRSQEKMRVVEPRLPSGSLSAELVDRERAADLAGALEVLAGGVTESVETAFAALQAVVRENLDVHQVVLAWRSYDLIRITGRQHAETLLLQALRQCVSRETARGRQNRPAPEIREALPLLMQRKGLGGTRMDREVSDAEVDALAWTFFAKDPGTAMEACAAALADGWSNDAVGAALALASVRLLLHDPGRRRAEEGKPVGTVHGASVGVHAADSANAWWHIANACASESVPTLLAAASHTAGQAHAVDPEEMFFVHARQDAGRVPEERTLDELEECVQAGNQALACALAERHARQGGSGELLIRRLAPFVVQQDGALHHEKIFHTVVEERQRGRPAFRELWLIALARIAASGQGFPAPGVAAAQQLLSA